MLHLLFDSAFDSIRRQIWNIDYFLLTLWRYLFPDLPGDSLNSVIGKNILI